MCFISFESNNIISFSNTYMLVCVYVGVLWVHLCGNSRSVYKRSYCVGPVFYFILSFLFSLSLFIGYSPSLCKNSLHTHKKTYRYQYIDSTKIHHGAFHFSVPAIWQRCIHKIKQYMNKKSTAPSALTRPALVTIWYRNFVFLRLFLLLLMLLLVKRCLKIV